MDSLSIHEVVLYWVIRDLLGITEDSLLHDKPDIASSHGLCERGPSRYRCVPCHCYGGTLVPKGQKRNKYFLSLFRGKAVVEYTLSICSM